MSLFLDDMKLTFEKVGMEARLSEDPAVWHQQVLDELYRQVPYASDYNPRVEIRDIDPDRRYGLGHIELINKLAINARDDDTPKELKGSQKVILPVVIQDGRLKPLDLMMHDGKVEPITEDRLRKALFRPNLHEAVRERPGDMSLMEQLYPPHRQFGGGRGDSGTKMASVRVSLLEAILPTITNAHLVAFTEKLASDNLLRASLVKNAATRECLSLLSKAEPASDGFARFKKVANTIVPTVMQVSKIPGGFRVKTASADALVPESEDLGRHEAVGALGGDMVSKVDQDGTQTITTQTAHKESLTDLKIETISQYGLYKVKTTDGHELVGWVFPHLMDLDGTLLPMSAFSNGSESAMQEAIAGVHVDDSTNLLDAHPQETGMFYYATPAGAQGMVPMLVKGSAATDGGESFMCETVMGQSCELVKIPGLKEISSIGEGRYGIPAECGFLPLPQMVDLASEPDVFLKQAQAKALPSAVRVLSDGSTYSFTGEPVEKLAGVLDTKFLTRDDAVFTAACLGYHPDQFSKDLDGMRKHGQYDLWFTARSVTTLKEKYANAQRDAKETLSKIAALGPIRVDLSKEAAVLEDPSAVDKVLSLGFINSENVSIFAGYIPEFENTISRLSELLMATRLGLQSVDEGALQKSIVHLDKVVSGLKTLGRLPQA